MPPPTAGEDPLQAVVLADSFETRFAPFSSDKPRCLLPLANTPLLEYTLNYLAFNGVDQVYVYCGAHTDQIEEYLKKSKWTTEASEFRTEIIRSQSRSVGDVMRDLDKRAILKNDFFVIYGDIVCNLPLDAALKAHRGRRAADKNAIMTMVLREVGGGTHRAQRSSSKPLFVLNDTNDRCIHYQELSSDPKETIHLPEELFEQNVELRSDVIDPGIDICTPEVLALWSDNFDYEIPRRGFLHGVLKDYELNGKTIHTYITSDYYANRIDDLMAYDIVSQDVLSGYTFPFSPYTNFGSETQSYCPRKGRFLAEDNVGVGRTTRIVGNGVVGKNSSIGEHCLISHSIIGRNCVIEDGCNIQNAYVWDNVKIGRNCVVQNAILADKVELGNDCQLTHGILLSYGVHLTEKTVLSNGERLVKKAKDQTPNWERLHIESNTEGALYSLQKASTSQDSLSTLESADDLEDGAHSKRDSFLSAASDESRSSRGNNPFVQDASSSIYDSLKAGHEVSTIQLELQGLRMSANASEHQLRHAVVSALMRRAADSQGASQASQIKKLVEDNKLLIERTLYDAGSDQKDDQVDFLLLVQKDLAVRPGGDSLLTSVCNALYLVEFEQDGDEDAFEGEAFQQWWDDPRSVATSELQAIREGSIQRFMKVVQANDEEDDDEDDDDEDEDEDEED